ncbi:Uncharacterized protein Fot_33241 [Forsythia ovata]|uniref:Uncharacterized protein n=1 Tax=Forsythia ovata TaxID=205694 RepID=A0ABD1TA34_9LAMI
MYEFIELNILDQHNDELEQWKILPYLGRSRLIPRFWHSDTSGKLARQSMSSVIERTPDNGVLVPSGILIYRGQIYNLVFLSVCLHCQNIVNFQPWCDLVLLIKAVNEEILLSKKSKVLAISLVSREQNPRR